MPEPVIFFILLVALPVVLICWLVRRNHRSKLDVILHIAFTGLFVLFLFFWGQYPYAGSFFLRYALVAVFMVAAIWPVRSFQRLPGVQKSGVWIRFLYGTFILFSLIFGALNILAVKAHFTKGADIDLSFPLKSGTYYIGTGGSNGVLNLHYKATTPYQMYAIDINKLNSIGDYAEGIFPNNSEEHYIFGETVFSPCSGEVVEVQNEVKDHAPFEVDMENPMGNYVIIDHAGIRIYLVHLMQGSLLVKEGDIVKKGEPVGRVGNSGFSTEPHLHLQATTTSKDDSTAFVVGVPIRINGRFLVRNKIFRN